MFASSMPLLGLLVAMSAGAEVTWRAPPGCPDRGAFLAMVERRLGRALGGDEARIEGRIEGDARRGFALRLTLAAGGRDEVRTIEDRSCAALAEAASVRVVAALASAGPLGVPAPPTEPGTEESGGQAGAAGAGVGAGAGPEGSVGAGAGPEGRAGRAGAPEGGRTDVASEGSAGQVGVAPVGAGSAGSANPVGAGPAASVEGGGVPGGLVGRPDPTVGPEASSEAIVISPEGQVQEDMYRGPGVVVRVQGGGEVGALPGPTGFGGLALGLLWPRLRLELHGVALAPRTRGLAGSAMWARLFAGGVQGCGRLGRGAIEVPLCVGLEVGAMQGEARGLPGARRATSWWLAGALGPAVVWHATSRIGVWAGLQLVLAPLRPRFEQGAGMAAAELFTPGVASGRLGLGIELRLRDRW